MTSRVAFVILAHNDAPKIRRLIGALGDSDVFLHCDRNTADHVARSMVPNAASRVRWVPRRRTTLATWSLVDAELAGLSMAVETTQATHVAVLSGSCYPLVSMRQLTDELSGWQGLSRLELNRLPYPNWSTARFRDGGLWRANRRFLEWRGQLLTIRNRPVPTFRRRVPPELSLYGSSQWKIYARGHARALLELLSATPSLRSFWQTTYVPEELCVASLLKSPDLVGPIAEQVIDDLPWFIRWPASGPTSHPDWLGGSDFDALRSARAAPAPDPSRQIDPRERPTLRKLFARKIGSASSDLLDQIDDELRA
ncbi:MAG: beta-1,6-N-acetylglucosaminyltransferase [Solirubrobacteraceae bacterium]